MGNELTPYQRFRQRWCEGCGSELCDRANRIVLSRGDIPCDVLFIGEAPGKSENASGIPFDGPAGHLLDRIIKRALRSRLWCDACRARRQLYRVVDDGDGDLICPNPNCNGGSYSPPWIAFTNLVGCIPLYPENIDESGRIKKVSDPDLADIDQCSSRLKEFYKLVRPQLVVHVGKVAARALDYAFKNTVKLEPRCKTFEIEHPASILRQNVSVKALKEQNESVRLATAFDSLELNTWEE